MPELAIEAGIAAVKVALMLALAFNLAGILGWMERKGSALIQDRIGANRAGIPIFGYNFAGAGLVNTLLADPIKFLTKEDVIPRGADRLLHTLAPIINLFPPLVTFAVIPFGDVFVVGDRVINLQVAPLNVGVLYILAMVSLGVYGVTLGGWASNNRWALLGGIRGSAQMISYEIPMGLSIVGVVLTYGTLDLQDMVRMQGSSIFGWGIFYQPISFILFLIAGIAESKRGPFDLPESESELVAGFFTEYSGVKHLMFFMTDFVEIVIVSALATTFFFGGWQVPGVTREGLHLGSTVINLGPVLYALIGMGAFTIKIVVLCWFQIMLRWTLPRFRYDQLMSLGWKVLLPLGLANIIVTAILILLWEGI